MMKRTLVVISAALTLAAPAAAQFGNLGKALNKAADVHDDLTFTDAEEAQLGADISAKLRVKYGVSQDKASHKYVTLVGAVLAAQSSRPNLKWTFIVLDTDGVNAFAAPGGFIHITRGALALIKNESELACVLGHEMSHVTAKHTLNAITKSKAISTGAKATGNDKVSQFVDRGYEIVLENKFDRKEEMEADKLGVTLASALGYAPGGLAAFLTRLADRNKNLKEPSGIFASHPETQARLDGLTKVIASAKLNGAALGAARFTASIPYKPVAVDAVPQGGSSTAAATPAPKAADSGGSSNGKLGLGDKLGLGREKSSSQTVSSAGSRGVNPDRDAKGGPVSTLVPVAVTAAEVADFKKGIA